VYPDYACAYKKVTKFGGLPGAKKFYMGIDVHKKSWVVTVRSLNFMVAHFTQPPSAKALLNYLQSKFSAGEFYSAYEAGLSGTGAYEERIHDSRSIAFNLEKGNLHPPTSQID
jgi:hypothetical protein